MKPEAALSPSPVVLPCDRIPVRALLDLFLPPYCLACGAPLLGTRRRWLCVHCLASIVPAGPAPCPVCAGVLGPGAPVSSCVDCARLGPRFSGAVAVGRYESILREAVTRMKYGPDARFAWPLGELLAETLLLWRRLPEVDLLVPVPTTFRRRVRRGFHPPELIAGEVGRRLGLPVSRRALRRTCAPAPQASRSRTERLRAQRDSMTARRAVRRKVVLLVDDVMTTGGTASEASRALLAAGARRVLVGVVARTVRG